MQTLKDFSRKIELKNGESVLLRAIRPDDKVRLVDGFNRLAGKSVYFRFFSNKRKLTSEELRNYTEIDFKDHVAIVATLQEHGEEKIIAVGRYIVIEERDKQKVAEVAFVIDDEHQQMGIGTILFENLITIAQNNGISIIVADVLLENRQMLDIFKHSGFKLHSTFELGIEHLEFTIKDQTFNRYY